MQNYQRYAYINYEAAIKLGLVGKIDIIDLGIMDYIITWAENEKKQTAEFDGKTYFWLDLGYAAKALPFLHLSSKQAMSLRVNKLKKVGLIEAVQDSSSRRLFFRLTGLGLKLKARRPKEKDEPIPIRGKMPDVKDISDVSEDSDTDESPFVNEPQGVNDSLRGVNGGEQQESTELDIDTYSKDNKYSIIDKDLSNQKHTTNLTTSSKFTLKNLDSENKQNSTIPVNKNGQSSTDFDIDAAFEELWKAYPSRTGKKQAKRHFVTSVKSKEDYERIRKALGNYKRSERVLRGYVMNGSTWFNNWQDWEQPTQAMMKSPKKTSYQFQEPPIDYVRQIEQFGGM